MAAHAEPPPVVCWNHLLKQACTYGRHCKREHLELDINCFDWCFLLNR